MNMEWSKFKNAVTEEVLLSAMGENADKKVVSDFVERLIEIYGKKKKLIEMSYK